MGISNTILRLCVLASAGLAFQNYDGDSAYHEKGKQLDPNQAAKGDPRPLSSADKGLLTCRSIAMVYEKVLPLREDDDAKKLNCERRCALEYWLAVSVIDLAHEDPVEDTAEEEGGSEEHYRRGAREPCLAEDDLTCADYTWEEFDVGFWSPSKRTEVAGGTRSTLAADQRRATQACELLNRAREVLSEEPGVVDKAGISGSGVSPAFHSAGTRIDRIRRDRTIKRVIKLAIQAMMHLVCLSPHVDEFDLPVDSPVDSPVLGAKKEAPATTKVCMCYLTLSPAKVYESFEAANIFSGASKETKATASPEWYLRIPVTDQGPSCDPRSVGQRHTLTLDGWLFRDATVLYDKIDCHSSNHPDVMALSGTMEKRSIGFGFFGKTRGRKARSALEQAEMQAKVAIKGNKTHVWGEEGSARISSDCAQSTTPALSSLAPPLASMLNDREMLGSKFEMNAEALNNEACTAEQTPVLPELPGPISPLSDPVLPILEVPAAPALQQTIRKQFSFCPSTLSVRESSIPPLVSLREQAEARQGSMRSLSTSSSGLYSPYPRHSAAAASKSNPSLVNRSRSYGSSRILSMNQPTRRSSTSHSVLSDQHVSIYGDDESDFELEGPRSPHGSLRYSHSLISRTSHERTALGSQLGSTLSLDGGMPEQICLAPVPDALRTTPITVPANQAFRTGTFDADEYELGDDDDMSSVSGMSVFSSLGDSEELVTSSQRQSSQFDGEPGLTADLHPGLRRASVKRSMRVSYQESGDGGYIVERRHRRKSSIPVTNNTALPSISIGPVDDRRDSDDFGASPQSPIDPAEEAWASKVQNIATVLAGSPSQIMSDAAAVVEEGDWVVEREYVPSGGI
ncbi:hypothetical protein BCR37DRAFT_394985 [Protomyces lactucae-debilis]|uniref:Uncharacterized protein n=1 Tax=Protomyces lactucae-debilis TaxID=2754530 RepID=A0A1Y2F0G0_PROLT|nr:uncharacterized protein BCR37DRAFT_394985 [Protomyces lactucae-debilis]ORY77368.1 hypothetical protein BCR37DRAFT_394985 [Protomyces lactucae-debilis]